MSDHAHSAPAGFVGPVTRFQTGLQVVVGQQDLVRERSEGKVMSALAWILITGVLMSLIALVGAVTFVLKESTLHKIILPLVALFSGSLLGGAFFHMIPASLGDMASTHVVFMWVLIGFTSFMILEQVLHWHHCHEAYGECKQPLSYLILIGDGLHNFIGATDLIPEVNKQKHTSENLINTGILFSDYL